MVKDDRLDQLEHPINLVVNQQTDSLVFSNYGNRRVMCWSHRRSLRPPGIIVDNLYCYGLTMNDQVALYVPDLGAVSKLKFEFSYFSYQF